MEKQKLNNIVFLAVTLIVVLIGALLLQITSLVNTTKDQVLDRKAAQQKFDADYTDISVILDYLLTFEDQSVQISDANGKATVAFHEIKIENEKVNNAVYNLLVKQGYRRIEKAGYTIYFEQWSGIRDINSGVAYTADGGVNLQLDFLTSTIALNKPNWYYCVCDYEAWRILQQNKEARDGSLS